jgi:hypothetical protein
MLGAEVPIRGYSCQLNALHDPQVVARDRENGIRVRPEHIHDALWELAGIADHPFRKKFLLQG